MSAGNSPARKYPDLICDRCNSPIYVLAFHFQNCHNKIFATAPSFHIKISNTFLKKSDSKDCFSKKRNVTLITFCIEWPLSFLPSQSETLQINPLNTLIPATMCVSFGVMLPVGNPPNAIVFSYGHLKISDMVRHVYGHTKR